MLDEVIATGLSTLDGPFAQVPQGNGAFAVMGKNGDTKYIWDKTKPAEVDAARAAFESLTKKNYLAFAVKGEGEQGDQVRTFDPTIERLIFVPQLKGG